MAHPRLVHRADFRVTCAVRKIHAGIRIWFAQQHRLRPDHVGDQAVHRPAGQGRRRAPLILEIGATRRSMSSQDAKRADNTSGFGSTVTGRAGPFTTRC